MTSSTLVLGEGFTEQEIDESKSYLIGSLPRQLETNAAIAVVPADRRRSSGSASTTTSGCRD